MKVLLFSLCLGATFQLCGAEAALPPLQATPIYLQLIDARAVSLPFELKPQPLFLNVLPGFEITYHVTGEGLSGYVPDSLAVTSITQGGARLPLQDEKGKPLYKLELPRFSADGKNATFVLRWASDELDTFAGLPLVQGRLKLNASQAQTEAHTLLLEDAFSPQKLGPFTFTLLEVPEDDAKLMLSIDGNLRLLKDVQLQAGDDLLDFGGMEPRIDVNGMEGAMMTMSQTSRATFNMSFSSSSSVNGKVTKTVSSSSSEQPGKTIQHTFARPNTPELTLTFSYWTAPLDQTVLLGL